MVRPLRVQYPDALYHVTNRGNDRKSIFKDDTDRQEFLKILSQSVNTYNVTLHAFVLMKNHWHLLAQTPLGNLGEFMRHFNITYTSHYNRRHNRSGHLYQGRYKSFLVEEDAYLSKVSRYIHLNPVKVAGLIRVKMQKRLDYLWNYKWSSLPGYGNLSKRFDFVTYSMVLEGYGGNSIAGRKKYKKQISEDLAGSLAIKEKIVGQSILGSSDFVSWVQKKYLENTKDRERPSVKKIDQYLSVETVLSVVSQETGNNDLLASSGTIRQIVMTALYQYAGLNNREIGELLGVDYSTVSQGRKRLRVKAAKDTKIRKNIERLEGELSRIKI